MSPRPRPAVLVLAAVALALAACREEAPPRAATGAPPPPAVTRAWRGSGETIELTAWRLECPGCAAKVREHIQKIEGVVSVTADTETSSVTVRIADPAKRDDVIPRIREAVHASDKKVLGEDPS